MNEPKIIYDAATQLHRWEHKSYSGAVKKYSSKFWLAWNGENDPIMNIYAIGTTIPEAIEEYIKLKETQN